MNELTKRNELVDNGIHNIAKIMEKWNNRLTLDNANLIDRYLKGDIEVLVHLRSIVMQSDVTEYCVIIKYPNFADRRWRDLESNKCRLGPSRTVSEINAATINVTSNDKQEAVLVDVVKFVNSPERVVPAFVRLDSVNETYNVRMNSLYFSKRMGFVFGRTIRDREVSVLSGRLAVSFNKLPNEMVETSSQVINNFSNNQRKGGWRLGDDFDLVSCLTGLHVLIDDKSIGVSAPESLDFGFQLVDVVFGPFDYN